MRLQQELEEELAQDRQLKRQEAAQPSLQGQGEDDVDAWHREAQPADEAVRPGSEQPTLAAINGRRASIGSGEDATSEEGSSYGLDPASDEERAAVAVAACSSGTSRLDLIAAVFRQYDEDGDGLLSSRELRAFAMATGFDGSDQEWQQEFEALTRSCRASVARQGGLGIADFR